jgi:hypothetical protein
MSRIELLPYTDVRFTVESRTSRVYRCAKRNGSHGKLSAGEVGE